MSAICRDCNNIESKVYKYAFGKSSNPKCTKCGGFLDWVDIIKKEHELKPWLYKISFGRYKGRALHTIPTEYLKCLLDQSFFNKIITTEVEWILNQRENNKNKRAARKLKRKKQNKNNRNKKHLTVRKTPTK